MPVGKAEWLSDVDERLHEWAYYFRDRRRLESCKSIESRYKRHSDDFAVEGWGDEVSAPKTQPARSYMLQRALQTHDAIQQLDRACKWAVTLAYCYPGLQRHVMLRLMKKYTGRRFTWRAFGDVIEVAQVRVYTALFVARAQPFAVSSV